MAFWSSLHKAYFLISRIGSNKCNFWETINLSVKRLKVFIGIHWKSAVILQLPLLLNQRGNLKFDSLYYQNNYYRIKQQELAFRHYPWYVFYCACSRKKILETRKSSRCVISRSLYFSALIKQENENHSILGRVMFAVCFTLYRGHDVRKMLCYSNPCNWGIFEI